MAVRPEGANHQWRKNPTPLISSSRSSAAQGRRGLLVSGLAHLNIPITERGAWVCSYAPRVLSAASCVMAVAVLSTTTRSMPCAFTRHWEGEFSLPAPSNAGLT